jgi:hypothetical protein
MRLIRRIETSDVSQLFRVRAATDENRLTLDQLSTLGINEKSVRRRRIVGVPSQRGEEGNL